MPPTPNTWDGHPRKYNKDLEKRQKSTKNDGNDKKKCHDAKGDKTEIKRTRQKTCHFRVHFPALWHALAGWVGPLHTTAAGNEGKRASLSCKTEGQRWGSGGGGCHGTPYCRCEQLAKKKRLLATLSGGSREVVQSSELPPWTGSPPHRHNEESGDVVRAQGGIPAGSHWSWLSAANDVLNPPEAQPPWVFTLNCTPPPRALSTRQDTRPSTPISAGKDQPSSTQKKDISGTGGHFDGVSVVYTHF